MIRVKVAKKAIEALDIVSLELTSEAGPLPAFTAGSHIDVEVKPGMIRQYSLCNHPAESDRYLIAVLREPNSRGGSVAVHDEIKVGDVVTISEPRNNFALVEAKQILLLAGGIGITPILSMAEWLWDAEVPFQLHYCTRSPSKAAFRDRLIQSPFGSFVGFHFDDGEASQKLSMPKVLGSPEPGKHLYICGPMGFIEAATASAAERGWPSETVHREYFKAPAPQPGENAAFQVKIQSTSEVIDILAEESVAAALDRHGIHIPLSCELGVCGTCLTRVLEGVPDHRDVYLTDEEKGNNDRFTPCCSRAMTPMLVLDL